MGDPRVRGDALRTLSSLWEHTRVRKIAPALVARGENSARDFAHPAIPDMSAPVTAERLKLSISGVVR
jgi:hypothetical protein